MNFTQNPIGSDNVLDQQDNAISFDYAMNSPAALWQDRFGKQHKTVQQALKDVGFKPAGFDFVSGGTLGIGDRDKCVFYPTDGYWYSWNGKLPYVVPANSSPTTRGPKGWVQRKFDNELREELAKKDSVVLIAGEKASSLARKINGREIYLTDFCKMDGISDDSEGFELALEKCYDLFDATPSAGKITIKNDGLIILGKEITVNVTKVGIKGGWIETKEGGLYPNNRLFNFNNGLDPVPFSSYNNRQVPILEGVVLNDKSGLRLNCFNLEQTSGDSNSSVCLQSFIKVTFHLFGKIFTHGKSGWGTDWYSCAARSCSSWMELTTSPDTYERHTFFACMWHNGSSGPAFIMNNINGRVYWYGGSCDYSSELAVITNGLLTFEGHIEYKNRTSPLIKINGDGEVKLGGLLAVLSDTGKYFLVEQYKDNQLILNDLFIMTDGNAVLGNLTNKRYKGRVKPNTPGGEKFISNDPNISPDMRVPTLTTSGTGLVVNQSSAELSIRSSINPGSAKGITIKSNVGEKSVKLGWNINYDNNTPYTIFITKMFESENALITEVINAGHTELKPNTSGLLSSVLMQQIPTWAKRIIFNINLANLGTTGELKISSLGLFEE